VQELRGCWEPKPHGPDVNVLSKVLDDAARLRKARTPVPAYRADDAPAGRDFVPVETVKPRRGGVPSRERAPGDQAPIGPPGDPLPPFVVEPEPSWGDRTSLFGEPEG
jgi:hypothetical protein